MWLIVGVLIIVAYFAYAVIFKPTAYWKKRKIPHQKLLSSMGDMKAVIFKTKSVVDLIKDTYNAFPNDRYFGISSFLIKPALQVRDPELIKQITVKDFDNFMNRTNILSEEADPLVSKNLGILHGQKWRDMRSTLSPSFTGNKMKFMFMLISQCAEQLTEYFAKQNDEIIEIEMKDVFSRYTNDVIATTAFGFRVNSLDDRDNEFFLMGKDFISPNTNKTIRLLGYTFMPALMKFFRVSMFPSAFSDFFRQVIKHSIEDRLQQGLVRPDMIHLLLQAREGRQVQEQERVKELEFAAVEEEMFEVRKKPLLTDDDIMGQALVFFLAGFDTASTLMSFMSHELAVNPEIQNKLRKEIEETLEKCNGEITYQSLLGMKYLDMVVSESLRKWPPGIALERVCEQDYVIEPKLPTETRLVVDKGTSISIPVVAIHHDPKYFPDPEKFDPERFSEENRTKIVPYSYIPFGVGPRNCIASRFALMETKILFFHLLSKFELVPTAKTPIPLVLTKKQFILAPEEGFWLGMKRKV